MTTAELFDLDDQESGPDKLLRLINVMKTACDADYKKALTELSIHEIGYRKGKVQAIQEVLELLTTGKLPEGY